MSPVVITPIGCTEFNTKAWSANECKTVHNLKFYVHVTIIIGIFLFGVGLFTLYKDKDS